MGSKTDYAGHWRSIVLYDEPQDILNASITDSEIERGKLTGRPTFARYVALGTNLRAQVGGVNSVQSNVAICAVYGSMKARTQTRRMPAAYDLEIRNIRCALHIYIYKRTQKLSFRVN